MATALSASIYIPPGMQLCDDNGDPLNGGKVNIYQAGTTTPDTSYPTYDDAIAGTNANANPVVLDSAGRAQIWLQAGRRYKLVVTDSANVTLPNGTVDDYSPALASADPAASEWVQETRPIAYVNSTTFNVTGDATDVYNPGRRIKVQQTSGEVAGTVAASSYGSPTTAVNAVMDSGTLDSGLSQVAYGLVSGPNSVDTNVSYKDPSSYVEAYIATTQAINTGAYRQIQFDTETRDVLSEYDTSTFKFTPKFQLSAGSWGQRYLFVINIKLQSSITSAAVALYKNGSKFAETTVNAGLANGAINCSFMAMATGSTDYFEVYVSPSGNVTIVGGADGTRLQVARLQ